MKILTQSEVRKAAGHCIVLGFEGTQLTPELKQMLDEVQPLGVIFFARNVESPEQFAELGAEIKSKYPGTILCIDQEGGRVQRVRAPATEWPPMLSFDENPEGEVLSRQAGKALGLELRAMNIDVNFAPVLDVHTNPNNPVIGDRAFSTQPNRAGVLASSFALGLTEADITPVGKHFPGHGDTDLDSHVALPVLDYPIERFQEIEWVPFKTAIRSQFPAMMTSHVLVPPLDEEHPATLSKKVLSHLRNTLGFNGVLFSDDIEMKAVADRYSAEEIARLGINAGVDIFLACKDPANTLALYRGLIVGVEKDSIEHRRIAEASKRATAFAASAYHPPAADLMSIVGCEAHQLLAQQLRAH